MAGEEVEAGRQPAWTRRDTEAAAVIAAIPALLLSVSAAAGYPLITGDDLVQNFPLEAFTGQVLRHGHMPLFDGLLWSGTPLLGGTNAHSFLPITLLFTVLPALVAWIVGEVVVLAGAAIGCQVFLKRTGCSTLAAALGGASFGLGGFMSSQIVHVDFAAAAAALPWALVGLHGLATSPASGGDARARHCMLLAGALAWICLAGSPDIVIDTVVVCGAFALHLLAQPAAVGRRTVGRLRFCAWSALGGLAGVAMGALQWFPSIRFVAVSQRAHPTLAFISGGSLTGANFLELLVPHVLGGGLFGTRNFGGTFPLAEVGAYPGTLALVAVFVALVGWRNVDAWRWRVWLVACGVALVVVSGNHTPFEHLVAALPIAGSQRLPSRGLIVVALAAALLLGYFVDEITKGRLGRAQVLAGLVPVVGILAVVIATLVTGRPAGGALTAHKGRGWSVTGVFPYLAVSAALALAAGALLLLGRLLPPGRRALCVGTLVVVDLLCFDANQSSLAPAYSSALGPPEQTSVQALTRGGRFVVVDPRLDDGVALDRLGAPDLGLRSLLPDASGYGSLMWGPYAVATGTHAQDGLRTAALDDGTLDSLGVKAVFTLPYELVAPVANGAGRGAGTGPLWNLSSISASTRWFGSPVGVVAVKLSLPAPNAPAVLSNLAATLRLTETGGQAAREEGVVTLSSRTALITFKPPVRAIGLRLGGPGLKRAVSVGEPAVTTAATGTFTTSGPLAAALSAPRWVEVGPVGSFSAFVTERDAPLFSLSAVGATWHVISSSQWTGATSVEIDSPRAATLTRSVAAIPGWQAVLDQDGRARTLTVGKSGLVQVVQVPAGISVVKFAYVAPGWAAGQLIAGVGALVFAGLGAAAVAGRRRRIRWAAGRRATGRRTRRRAFLGGPGRIRTSEG